MGLNWGKNVVLVPNENFLQKMSDVNFVILTLGTMWHFRITLGLNLASTLCYLKLKIT